MLVVVAVPDGGGRVEAGSSDGGGNDGAVGLGGVNVGTESVSASAPAVPDAIASANTPASISGTNCCINDASIWVVTHLRSCITGGNYPSPRELMYHHMGPYPDASAPYFAHRHSGIVLKL